MRTSRKAPAVLVLVLSVGLVGAARADDPREVEGRAAFARGEYDSALAIFSRLFAENGDPVFLRNIGRCYQQMRNPDRAISAFREYLRRSRDITGYERAEVEGFIAEMEALRATAHPAPPSLAPARSPPPAVVAAPPPSLVVVAPPEPERRVALTRRWWFWAAVGTALAAGAATALVLASRGGAGVPGCPTGADCPR